MADQDSTPYGYCQCGCGRRTTIATKNAKRDNLQAGRPMRFISGHNSQLTPERRFWLNVEPIQRATDCWLWIGSKAGIGYGKFEIADTYHRAHRFIWALVHGPIPEGLCVRHKCDNPSCVNPHHMELGTHGENVADKVQKHRQARGVTHGNAKLTDDVVRAIREATGKHRDIGKLFGLSQTTISRIKRGASWAHVT